MRSYLLKLALILITVLIPVSIVAKAFGTLQPPSPALRGFIEGCEEQPQPCWYGIVPGITTLEQARTRIISLGYMLSQQTQDAAYYYKDDPADCPRVILSYTGSRDPAFSIHLYQCNQLSIGDSAQLGRFKHILKTSPGDYNISVDDFYTITIHPCNGYTLRCTVDFSPDINITTVHFSNPSRLNATANKSGVRWHGFLAHWRFCQLEPSIIDCLP